MKKLSITEAELKEALLILKEACTWNFKLLLTEDDQVKKVD